MICRRRKGVNGAARFSARPSLDQMRRLIRDYAGGRNANGGWNQSQAHAQFVSNVVDRGMNIQAALDAARFTKLSFEGRDVAVERRIPDDVRLGLAARGHELEVQGDYCSFMGGGQAVARREVVNYGASDPRKDGAAVPEPVWKE